MQCSNYHFLFYEVSISNISKPNTEKLKRTDCFPVAQTAKDLPAMQETWVQTLSQEDLLEKGMATHSSILAWEIPWTVAPRRLQSIGSQRSQTQLSN